MRTQIRAPLGRGRVARKPPSGVCSKASACTQVNSGSLGQQVTVGVERVQTCLETHLVCLAQTDLVESWVKGVHREGPHLTPRILACVYWSGSPG